ncbi:MAG: polyprenyl synthetase family protein [bacterium]
MTANDREKFLEELKIAADQVAEYLLADRFLQRFRPDDILDAVTLYVQSGGKRLRPAILLWSCGALGGDPQISLPAASAVEIFHTWTLIHDDILDRDDRRRGSQTVHERFRHIASARNHEMADRENLHYGVSVAILAGDVQHGWGVTMLTELSERFGVDPEVTLHLIEQLDNDVLNLLVEGELLDIQYMYQPLEALSLDSIEDMLWKKTGVLYQFCAHAGGMIGLGRVEPDHPQLKTLEHFASRCGLAFQLQDDLLGVIGDTHTLGKPVGNDIREGKRTALIYFAWKEADPAEREIITRCLGNVHASESEVREVIRILERRGAIEMTRRRAHDLVEEALPLLDPLPDTPHRKLLRSWGEFMIARED